MLTMAPMYKDASERKVKIEAARVAPKRRSQKSRSSVFQISVALAFLMKLLDCCKSVFLKS